METDTLARARNGDREAQAALYASFNSAVYTLARRLLVKPELAEDALQDTFVEVMRGLPAFRAEAPVGLWIRRIAVNRCLMQIRSSWQRYRTSLAPEDNVLAADAWRHDEDAAWQNVLDIEQALEALPVVTRAVVWLHDVEGYTHKEIAEFMHATPGFSKSQLARGYARMRHWATEQTGEKICTPVLNG